MGRRQQPVEPVELAVPVESAVQEKELAVVARLGPEEAVRAEYEEAGELVVHLSPGRFHC